MEAATELETAEQATLSEVAVREETAAQEAAAQEAASLQTSQNEETAITAAVPSVQAVQAASIASQLGGSSANDGRGRGNDGGGRGRHGERGGRGGRGASGVQDAAAKVDAPEAQAALGQSVEPPDDLVCSICMEVLTEAVMSSTGMCFQEHAIRAYMAKKDEEAGTQLDHFPCPMTGRDMSRIVTPCFAVRNMAQLWLDANPISGYGA